MSWNYRIIKRTYENEDSFAVHEVYYDKDNNIDMISSNPIYIYGSTLGELYNDLELYKMAFDMEVLDYDELMEKFNVSKTIPDI